MENKKENIEPLFIEDFKLLNLFNNYYYKYFNEDLYYTSSKLRAMIDKEDFPCITLKTYDSGIKLLNSELNFANNWKEHNINLACQSIDQSKIIPLHTRIFFQRLPSCFNLFEKELYEYKGEAEEHKHHREIFNKKFGFLEDQYIFPENNGSAISSYNYAFKIQKHKMPPFFAPLFIGIVGSLKKEKTNWKNFREHALNLAEEFYKEEYQKINVFIPNDENKRKSLYTYWLELFYPDELFNLITEIDKMIFQHSDLIFSYNLCILSDAISYVPFLTRIGTKMFCQWINITISDYKKTPTIDSDTGKLQNIDLFTKFDKIRCYIQNYESNILRTYRHELNS